MNSQAATTIANRFLISTTQQFINNTWSSVGETKTLRITNPATGASLSSIGFGSRPTAAAAVLAAQNAFTTWKNTTSHERAILLHKLSSLMLNNIEDLANLMTLEQGKPISESRGEINYAVSFLTWAAEEGKRLYGEVIPPHVSNKVLLTLRQPVGVIACITPWNFPSAMITRKIGPALAAGCTTIIKPSELTPLSAFAIATLAKEAGFPDGVINVIVGEPDAISDELFENPTVRKVSFTGSTPIGKRLIQKSATTVTRLSLELGGHAPFIVFDDANLEEAIKGAMATKYRNVGQTCICANRFYIQSGIYKDFVSGFHDEVKKLTIGNGLNESTLIGPMINQAAITKVQSHIANAVDKGACLTIGGNQVTPAADLSNQFIEPAILENCTDDMQIFNEETFGPVSPIQSFTDEEVVIQKANNSPFGLAAYFYTQNASRLYRVASQLEYGIVGANDGGPSTAQAPFGGVKESGYGREGGKYVMDEYTSRKYISWGL